MIHYDVTAAPQDLAFLAVTKSGLRRSRVAQKLGRSAGYVSTIIGEHAGATTSRTLARLCAVTGAKVYLETADGMVYLLSDGADRIQREDQRSVVDVWVDGDSVSLDATDGEHVTIEVPSGWVRDGSMMRDDKGTAYTLSRSVDRRGRTRYRWEPEGAAAASVPARRVG